MYRELLLGEQREHEVVLVVPGRGDDDVARVETGRAQRVHLAAVGDVPVDAVPRLLGALHDGRQLLDDHHVMVGGAQVVGDEQPDVPRACDGNPHQWCSSPCSSRWRSVSMADTSAAKCRMSPSWPIALGVLTCAAPRRVMATSQNTPGSLSGASFLPAHFGGSGESTRHTLPLGSSHSCGCSSAGSRRRITWSVVHDTVATVGM